MARTVTASRLRRYVGGLAALSVVRTEPVERSAEARPGLRLVPRDDTPTTTVSDPEAAAQAIDRAVLLISREEWSRAQRLLEQATRQDSDKELASYLDEVRAVRRVHRQLIRRPRDAQLHLELGRLYFGLELGDQARDEFRRAVDLEPTLSDAYFYLSLDHIFRDEETAAKECLARAGERRPNLPNYEALRLLLYRSAEV